MNQYEPYSMPDLGIIMNETWEVADDPYKLHAAFALSCLYDLLEPDDDEEVEFEPEDMWGQKLPKLIVDRLVKDIAADFNDAAETRTPLTIFGKRYTIRKVNAYDKNRIDKIFSFASKGKDCLIFPTGILDLSGKTPSCLEQYEVSREESKKTRTYLRQIIKLAEDDENNGWDSLSDMEIVFYCWGLFYNKYQSDNFKHFLSEYKDYIYVEPKEIKDCFNSKSELRGRPVGMYPFSYEKIQEWNNDHGQSSVTIKIPESEADDYWYDIALKNTFKPIDERKG